MPPRSKAQFRFMEARAHGKNPNHQAGPTKKQAQEFLASVKPGDYKKLPEKKGKKKSK